MSISRAHRWRGFFCGAVLLAASNVFALDPHKGLTQYSRTVWTQQQGLPQDTVRTIAQTADGYLWVGTDEGLARFDGYEFTTFRKGSGDLPSNSITALAATSDGALWIGTPSGLTRYRDKRFYTYTTKSGLPDDAISALYTDHGGTLWIVAGQYLSRFADGQFTSFAPGPDLPVASVRLVCEDRNHDLWVAGYGGVGKLVAGKFTMMIDGATLAGLIATSMAVDARGTLWLAGSQGMVERRADGQIRKYGIADGLPDSRLHTVLPDRDGGIWVGTDLGLARQEGGRFVSTYTEGIHDHTQVWCLFEDREGDLWVGANTGLVRLRDDVFTVYGKSEGLPSDEPNVVFQDRAGRVWVGFRDGGLLLFSNEGGRQFSVREGLPGSEVFSVRETRNGDLLIAVHGGVARMHGEHFDAFTPPDPFSRLNVYDALEDAAGDVWLATPGGLSRLHGGQLTTVIPGGPVRMLGISTLCAARDGALWAGTFGQGLWRIQRQGAAPLHHRRRAVQRPDPHALRGCRRDPVDRHLRRRPERAARRAVPQLHRARRAVERQHRPHHRRWRVAVAEHHARHLPGLQTAVAGPGGRQAALRSIPPITGWRMVCAARSARPRIPTAAGGARTSDGKLWFTTSRGLAVFDPRTQPQPRLAPVPHLVEMTANGEPVDLASAANCRRKASACSSAMRRCT